MYNSYIADKTTMERSRWFQTHYVHKILPARISFEPEGEALCECTILPLAKVDTRFMVLKSEI